MAHGGVYAGSRLVNALISFLLIPLYAHLLGDDGYGVISLMMIVTSVGQVLMGQGLGGAWYRLRFEYEGAAGLRRFETSVIWYMVGSIAVLVGLSALLGPWVVEKLTPGVGFYPYWFLALLTAGGMALVDLYFRKQQALQRPVGFAIFSALRSALIPGGIVLFMVALGRGASGKLEGEALAEWLLAVLALWLLRPGGLGEFRWGEVRRSLAYGLPLVGHQLAAIMNNLIDQFLVNGYLGLAATGVYAMGYKVASASALVAVTLNQAFSPLFMSALKESERARGAGEAERARRSLESVARAAVLLLVVVACGALVLTALGRELLAVLATGEFGGSWRVLALVSAGEVVMGGYLAVSGAVFYHVRRVRLMPLLTVAAAGVNVVANVLMIPRFGIMGAAWATLLSNAVLFGATMLVAQWSVAIPHRWGQWGWVMGATGVALAGLWVVDAVLWPWWLRLGVKVLIAGVAIVVMLWRTHCRMRDLKRLWGGKKAE